MPHENPHKNRDPMTGGCLDCGATREAIDDNLFPVCEKFEGPHRLALIAIHQAANRAGGAAAWARRRADEAEQALVSLTQEYRARMEDERQLKASLDYLRGPVVPSRNDFLARAINQEDRGFSARESILTKETSDG